MQRVDVEEVRPVKRNKDSLPAQSISGAVEVHLLQHAQANPGWLSLADVVCLTGLDPIAAMKLCRKLVKRGLLEEAGGPHRGWSWRRARAE